MYDVVRVLIAAVAVLMFIGGIALLPLIGFGAIQLVLFGGAGILAIVLERGRYRSEHAERSSAPAGPGGGEPDATLDARFLRTEEAFVDPTSGRHMRVWLDPRTGERRYRAEG
jgi:hypothetical protein